MLSALKPSLFVEEIDPRLKRAIGATKGINVSFRNTPSGYIKTLTFHSPQGDFCEPRGIKQTSDTGIIRCPCPITGEMILGWLASELKAVCRRPPELWPKYREHGTDLYRTASLDVLEFIRRFLPRLPLHLLCASTR